MQFTPILLFLGAIATAVVAAPATTETTAVSIDDAGPTTVSADGAEPTAVSIDDADAIVRIVNHLKDRVPYCTTRRGRVERLLCFESLSKDLTPPATARGPWDRIVDHVRHPGTYAVPFFIQTRARSLHQDLLVLLTDYPTRDELRHIHLIASTVEYFGRALMGDVSPFTSAITGEPVANLRPIPHLLQLMWHAEVDHLIAWHVEWLKSNPSLPSTRPPGSSFPPPTK